MKTIKRLLLGALGLFGLLVVWGLLEPYFLDVEEETAVIPDLPKAWEGQKIGQVTDFQIGMWMDNVPTAHRSIETLVELQPAAVLVSGDFIYHALPNPDVEMDKVIEVLKPLTEAKIPTYAVLGNHDYGHKPPQPELGDRVKARLEKLGVVVLENEAVQLSLLGNPASGSEDPLYLVGVGSLVAKNDKVSQALSQVPNNSPRIVMMHNPQSFKQFPEQTAPLAVAGHTHGGQMRIPFMPHWSWISLTQKHEVHGDGWIKNYGGPGNQLYVNRGIGFSDVPIRINCRPEVTVFTLRSS